MKNRVSQIVSGLENSRCCAKWIMIITQLLWYFDETREINFWFLIFTIAWAVHARSLLQLEIIISECTRRDASIIMINGFVECFANITDKIEPLSMCSRGSHTLCCVRVYQVDCHHLSIIFFIFYSSIFFQQRCMRLAVYYRRYRCSSCKVCLLIVGERFIYIYYTYIYISYEGWTIVARLLGGHRGDSIILFAPVEYSANIEMSRAEIAKMDEKKN